MGAVEPKAPLLRIDKQGELPLGDILAKEPDLTLEELAERHLPERGIGEEIGDGRIGALVLMSTADPGGPGVDRFT